MTVPVIVPRSVWQNTRPAKKNTHAKRRRIMTKSPFGGIYIALCHPSQSRRYGFRRGGFLGIVCCRRRVATTRAETVAGMRRLHAQKVCLLLPGRPEAAA